MAGAGAARAFNHIWFMAGRPCNPNGDLKRLWQLLLPDAPFPQCGTPTAPGTTNLDETRLAEKRVTNPEQPAPADRDT